jgi:RNA polymerase sigma-70 factor (ECF subfamily)
MPRGLPETDEFIPTRRTLLSRLRNLDDAVSWRDFFDTYWKLIYRAATQTGLSDADAQDVVQETIITISKRIQDFQYDPARGSFKGWLLHTTRWRILDHLRKRRTEASLAPPPADLPEAAVLERIPDPVSAQLEALWEAEWQQNLLDAALQRIKRQVKPKHFQVFELCALKAWPPAKVARALGVNVAQVHLLKHRVGNLIRKEVKRLEAKGV